MYNTYKVILDSNIKNTSTPYREDSIGPIYNQPSSKDTPVKITTRPLIHVPYSDQKELNRRIESLILEKTPDYGEIDIELSNLMTPPERLEESSQTNYRLVAYANNKDTKLVEQEQAIVQIKKYI